MKKINDRIFHLCIEAYDIEWYKESNIYGPKAIDQMFEKLPNKVTFNLECTALGDMQYQDGDERKDVCVCKLLDEALPYSYHFKVKSYNYKSYFKKVKKCKKTGNNSN